MNKFFHFFHHFITLTSAFRSTRNEDDSLDYKRHVLIEEIPTASSSSSRYLDQQDDFYSFVFVFFFEAPSVYP
tara:strand:- start:1027 stop:1245 length:219 start_codon:yes stop_codon:yes gene_type:complete